MTSIRVSALRSTALTLAFIVMAPVSRADPRIHALTPVIEGHAVGGVTIDSVRNLYVADFGDNVWKITPEGVRSDWAAGLYGASGNAIDNAGNLLQSSFYGDSITKIDRRGQATPFVETGLRGPVGIAINRQTGDVYVTNCRANTIAKIATDRTVSTFATSPLFKCPNGITFDQDGSLYTVNFRDNQMLKIDAQGVVSLFARVSEKGLGHLCFRKSGFYVTAFESHAVYEVTRDGKARRLLGNGERGIVDGSGDQVRLSFPNGIACDPWAPRLYINEYVADSADALPRRTLVRVIELDEKE